MIIYLKPRLKPFIEYHAKEGKVYFFKNPGNALEFADQTNFIFKTCNVMDGKKTYTDIVNELSATHPGQVHYLLDLLHCLDNHTLLEDETKNVSDNLSTYDVVRCTRNIEFFGAYTKASENKFDLQKIIKKLKVTLLGLGGAGSHLLYDLAALGVEDICAVDYDKVELSNLNRQILYYESDIGKEKTVAAKEKMQLFAPRANIHFINKKISSFEDI